ncbi:protein FATTY ACID EXPORT 1, chloroplastic-like [Macadamia integrifolia]|uniref:protein FATTY ACID EXPORT 1, chloroplastic-like n=1 Tax=Macadamia integrifolia TaxID=60698 RepID=UPI001C52AF96|nr:protein FATTY ACID EXPORT 1, chloroplastic-like [Macadamia integrifolia]
MTSAIAQLSSISSVNRKLQLQKRSFPPASLRSKLPVSMHLEGSGIERTRLETMTTLSYTSDPSVSHVEGTMKSYPNKEEQVGGKLGVDDQLQEQVVTEQKRAAKIHDFCFGIPFGGLVLSGGLVGFVFSRNLTTLSTGVLFGGALLALSTTSLKVWRQGKSSLPFILGQAALAAALLAKHYQTYSLTKFLPTGFYAIVSAAMLCFYSYVVISGGNPPPKKLKSAKAASS